MNDTLWETVEFYVNSNRLGDAIKFLESGLEACSGNRFKSIIGADFTNSPKDIAHEIDQFIEAQTSAFSVKAVYLEMNGFLVNPGQWSFDFFGYADYDPDPASLDWLSTWDSGSWPDVKLTGLEAVMNDYSWFSYHLTKRSACAKAEEAEQYASLLVVCKFALLIEKASKLSVFHSNIPILATAHDYDIIPRFLPGSPTSS